MIEGVTKINAGLDIKGPKICGEIILPGVDIKGAIFDIHETEIGADKKGPVLNNGNKIDEGTNIKESKIPVIGVDTKEAGLDIHETKIGDEDKIGANIKGPVLNNKNKIDSEINIKEPKIPVIGIETKEAGLDIHEPKIKEGMDIKEPSGNESNLFGSINNINEMKVNQNLSNINNEKIN